MSYLVAKFNDASLEEQMNQNGFIRIPDFLSYEQVSCLKDLYSQYHTSIDLQKGMWNSMYDVGAETASIISSKILETVIPELEKTFSSFIAPVASFMSKNPGNHGVCEFHRDFSILDESAFEYRNVWIPLIDIEQQNGALYALKGSHKAFNYPLPMFEKWPYTNTQEKLFDFATIFSVKAGDLVVYTDRTLHGSMLNLSEKTRPVVHLGLLHPQAKIQYYHLSNNVVKVFDVPFEFYFENNFRDLEGEYPLVNKFDYSPPIISEKELIYLNDVNLENQYLAPNE